MQELTIKEAFDDFISWAFHPDNVQMFSPENRHYFRKTAGDVEAGNCGSARIKNIFERHVPGRYVFNEATFTKTETP